jgi:hypothetical protein
METVPSPQGQTRTNPTIQGPGQHDGLCHESSAEAPGTAQANSFIEHAASAFTGGNTPVVTATAISIQQLGRRKSGRIERASPA